jgi:hypothetical protein
MSFIIKKNLKVQQPWCKCIRDKLIIWLAGKDVIMINVNIIPKSNALPTGFSSDWGYSVDCISKYVCAWNCKNLNIILSPLGYRLFRKANNRL